jgi:putative SOS response-associated peptidase YedK
VIDLPDRTHIRELALLRWGLLPAWAKDRSIGASMINARSETAHEKVSFRQPLASRRCLLPADGYYEWQRAGKTKQPFHIHGTRGEILWFAGLWESNSKLGADQQPLRSCTILTQAASETLAPIHDRMPVLVDPALHEVWLSEETDGRALLERLIEVGSETRLAADPISSYVNNARHEGPQCLTPPLDNTCEDTRPGEAPRT